MNIIEITRCVNACGLSYIRPEYNTVRTHQGRWCYGKTPMQTFLDTLPLAREKLIQAA